MRLLQDELLSDAELAAEAPVTAYWDPQFRGAGKVYRDFIRDLDARGVIGWRVRARSEIGMLLFLV